MEINAGEPKILNYLHGVATKKKFPVSCNFELTPRCNMNCKMCYIRKTEKEISSTGKRERTAQEWIDLGSQCRDAGTLFYSADRRGTLSATGFQRDLYCPA